MREELLAYLLDDLDARQRRQVEEHLRQDSHWRQEYDRLRQCLRNSASDLDYTAEPPNNLAHRTCTLIENVEHDGKANPTGAFKGIGVSEQTETSEQAGYPKWTDSSPKSGNRDSAPCANAQRYSLTDLAVAIGVMVILAMLLLPSIHHSREMARRLQCQNNLRELGIALVDSEMRQQRLPSIAPYEHAGVFVIELAERGIIRLDQLSELVICPASPQAQRRANGDDALFQILSRHQMNNSRSQTLRNLLLHMAGIYAYRFGYFDHGDYHNVQYVGRSDEPMLADAPGYQVNGYYSSNHGGCGQNVISQDLSLVFSSRCMAAGSEDNIYLNAEGRPAAGRHRRDIVLGGNGVRPDGRIIFPRQETGFPRQEIGKCGARVIEVGD
jgi:uncharacterized protein DUF1559